MTKQKMTALIAGGGLGGLATAAALAQKGWDVTVLERQPALRAIGSGIYIWENGLRVLKAIDAYEEAIESAFYGSHFEMRDKHNDIIDSAPTPPERRLITVLRSQLLKSLEMAAQRAGVTFKTQVEVIGASPRGELLLSTGKKLKADLVIGADGIWSRVRQSLGLGILHEQLKEGALRTMIPRYANDMVEGDEKKYIENWNGVYRLLITPVSETEIYLALTCPHDDERGSSIPVDIEFWAGLFPQWAHLIKRIGPEVTWGQYSVIKCKEWSAGRAAILGDAAHAQPPNLGQGGGLAMQNGLALSHFLKDVTSREQIPDALEAWEKSERALVDGCQRWSCLYGEISYLPDEARTRMLKAALADPWLQEEMFSTAASAPTGA